jgi:ribonucleoside-diphosphate reductase alpha chain
MESPNIGKMSSMYMYAWQKGLKTTYYLRSRPATKINQVSAGEARTSSAANEIDVANADVKAYSDEEALVCSLENPESCEACQ